jgi:hypothetical protein
MLTAGGSRPTIAVMDVSNHSHGLFVRDPPRSTLIRNQRNVTAASTVSVSASRASRSEHQYLRTGSDMRCRQDFPNHSTMAYTATTPNHSHAGTRAQPGRREASTLFGGYCDSRRSGSLRYMVLEPIWSMLIRTTSPPDNVKSSPGTMPVPVIRKTPCGNLLSRNRYSTSCLGSLFSSATVVCPV